MNSFWWPGVSVINIPSNLWYMKGQFQDFQNMFQFILSQLFLLNLVSWQTLCCFEHCPTFEVFDSSQCLRFHSLEIADHAHGLPKPWWGLSHPDCSWMHLEQAEWHAPCMVCGFLMQATRFRSLQGLVVIRESSSNLRKRYQLYFQSNGCR